jgi:hypothetical protein
VIIGGRTGAAAGICKLAPHCRHLVVRPANSSGTLYDLEQLGQAKAMDMMMPL